RRIVDVRHERVRILRAYRVRETRHEAFDHPVPVPAHDGRRDLVAYRIGEHGRMPRALSHTRTHAGDDGGGTPTIVEESDVLFPGQTDEDVEPVGEGRIQHVSWRHRVGADGVEAACRDVNEI